MIVDIIPARSSIPPRNPREEEGLQVQSYVCISCTNFGPLLVLVG